MYCYLVTCPAPRHNGHVIAPDTLLTVPCSVRHIIAGVPAGHLALDAVLDVRRQRLVVDVQVCDDKVPLAPHVLDVPAAVCRIVFRADVLGRVPVSHRLALEAREYGGLKHVFRPAVDDDGPLGVAVQHEFTRHVLLRPCPRDGHVAADQIPLDGLGLVGVDVRAVVCNGHHSTPGTSSSCPALSPATASSNRSAITA